VGLQRASGDDPVARLLRQEVRFRCPVPGCGSPILTYHHFDPPWREAEHNDPNGMIALCISCHGKADGGRWTKQQLHTFKSNPHIHLPAQENLLCLEPRLSALYRIGANYLLDATPLVIGDRPIVWQNRTEDGMILFSFDLRGQHGHTLLAVRDNSLAIDELNFWDFFLNTHGNHLIVKPKHGQIALDLHLKRLSVGELTN
jgi:hypothetical protein